MRGMLLGATAAVVIAAAPAIADLKGDLKVRSRGDQIVLRQGIEADVAQRPTPATDRDEAVAGGAFRPGFLVVLADSELGRFNTETAFVETDTQKRDRLPGLANGNAGIVKVDPASIY